MQPTGITFGVGNAIIVGLPLFLTLVLSLIVFIWVRGIPKIKQITKPPPKRVEIPGSAIPESTKIALIQLLNEETKVSIGLCKRALEETHYNYEASLILLETTQAANNEYPYGKVFAQNFENVGVLVEINCKKKITEQSLYFALFVQDIAAQIAACKPKVIQKFIVENTFDPLSSIPPPPPVKDDSVLFNQTCIVPGYHNKTVAQVIRELSQKLDDDIRIRRFARFEIKP